MDLLGLELVRQRRFAALLLELTDRIEAAVAGGNRGGALPGAAEALRAYFAVDACAVSRIDARAASLAIVAASDGRSAPPLAAAQVRMPWTVLQMRRGRRIVFLDPSDLPEQAADLRRWARSAGVIAHVSTPMLAEGVLVGGLHVSATGASRRWSQTELRELDTLAALLAPALLAAAPGPGATRTATAPRPSERLEDVERAHILEVLQRANWRINGKGNAAERLGLHPSTLRSRLEKLGVRRPRRGGA